MASDLDIWEAVIATYRLGALDGVPEVAARGELGRVWRVGTDSGVFAIKELLAPQTEQAAAADVRFQRAVLAAGVDLPAPVTAPGGRVLADVRGRIYRAYEWVDMTPLDEAPTRFDAELGREIAPFAAVLLRSESAASSKIENLTASARAIAEAALHGHAGRDASLIVANERAMTAAIALAERLDGDAFLAMHAALLERSNPGIAGRWRDQQVWIGGGDLGPHGAAFVPPHQSRVPAAIADLVTFIDRDDVPVLAHAALAHAQFETIHPFPDGNGRTGRALVHAHLRSKGLIRNVTVPVSAGLLTDLDGYFAALTGYREGDPTAIVEAFAAAGFQAVTNGRRLVDDLHAIHQDWQERVSTRRDAAAWRVADVLLRHPVVNAALVAAEVGIAAQNTYRSLRPLVEAGVLVEFTDRKRNQLWRAPDVLDALDRFATRAGRRNRSSARRSLDTPRCGRVETVPSRCPSS